MSEGSPGFCFTASSMIGRATIAFPLAAISRTTASTSLVLVGSVEISFVHVSTALSPLPPSL